VGAGTEITSATHTGKMNRMHEHLTRRDLIKTILVTSAVRCGRQSLAAKAVSEVTRAIDPNVGVATRSASSFAA